MTRRDKQQHWRALGRASTVNCDVSFAAEYKFRDGLCAIDNVPFTELPEDEARKFFDLGRDDADVEDEQNAEQEIYDYDEDGDGDGG